MSDTFSQEVREDVMEAQNYRCAYPKCSDSIHSFHHKVENTKTNRKLFPLLIQSVFNCVALCYHHHDKYCYEFKISEKLAMVFEKWLEKITNKG